MEFYVEPKTNELIRIDDFETRKATKNLSKTELRKYREGEKRKKLEQKRSKRNTKEEIIELEKVLNKRLKNDQ